MDTQAPAEEAGYSSYPCPTSFDKVHRVAAMKRATAPLLLFAVVLPACFTPDVDAVRDRWKECGVVPEEAIEACSADQGSEACNDGYDSAILQSVDSIEEEQCILAVSCDDPSDDKTNELTACLNA